MSSTLAKEFDHKLLIALKDARVACLNNKDKVKNEIECLNEIRDSLLKVEEAINEENLNKQYKATTKAIALLLNYQIKFL